MTASPVPAGVSWHRLPGGYTPELAIEPRRGALHVVGGVLVGAMVRFLGATARIEHIGDPPAATRATADGFVLACWHRYLVMLPWCRWGDRISIMISQHRDGDLAAVAADRLGIASVRGSSTRGGTAALRALLRQGRAGYDLAFAPDGPKGPPGVAKPGIVQTAAALGWPIVPVGIAASRYRRLGSWDRMLVPKIGARVAIAYGDPLTVTDRRATGAAAEELTRRLDAAVSTAERAIGGRSELGPGE